MSSPLILRRGSAELMREAGWKCGGGEHKGLASATQGSAVPLARCAQFTKVPDEGDLEARVGVGSGGNLIDLQTETNTTSTKGIYTSSVFIF